MEGSKELFCKHIVISVPTNKRFDVQPLRAKVGWSSVWRDRRSFSSNILLVFRPIQDYLLNHIE